MADIMADQAGSAKVWTKPYINKGYVINLLVHLNFVKYMAKDPCSNSAF